MTSHRRPIAVVATATMASVLAACSIPVPEPSPSPSFDDGGAVRETQAERIAQQTFAEIAAADEAKDASLLGVRVGDGVGLARVVEYTIASKGGDTPTVITGGIQAFYTTNSEDWPRPLVGVTAPEDATQPPVILAWIQDSSWEGYVLQAWASVVPGAVLPAMPDITDGADLVPLDASGLTMTPGEAIEQYVTLLNEGGDSGLDEAYAPDPYREGMFEARSSLSTSAASRKGTFTDTVEAVLPECFALADAEGGALVFMRLSVVSDFNVPGATLTLPSAADKALLEGTLKSRVVYRYEDVVVIRLQPEGSIVLPTVVAAGQHLVGIATS